MSPPNPYHPQHYTVLQLFISLYKMSNSICYFVVVVVCFVFCLFCFFRAAPEAYGGSQARGRIGAVALAYTTATATRDLSLICNLHHSSQQCQIQNLSEARDRTLVLMDAS